MGRGYAVLAVDGPGQGETAADGLTVAGENYERAMVAFIDHMVAQPEIDGDVIGIWGVSMGSYWGLRTAAADQRIKAVATAMDCYGQMNVIFERAQPGFKANFMRMTGYTAEDLFDADVASMMGIAPAADWLSHALAGALPKDEAVQAYIKRTGGVSDRATPSWWLAGNGSPVT